jgi:hypothetical protein
MSKKNTLATVAAEDALADKALEDLRKQIESPTPPAQPTDVQDPPLTQPTDATKPTPPVPAKKGDEPVVDQNRIIASLEKALDTAKNNYKSIKGKFDAEIPRYADEIKSLKADIASLKTQLEEANEKAAAIPQVVQPQEVPAEIRDIQNDLGLDDASGKKLNAVIESRASAIAEGVVKRTLTAMGIKPGKTEKPAPATPAPVAAVEQPTPAAPAKEAPNLSDESWDVFYSYIPEEVYAEKVYKDGKFSPELFEFLRIVDPKTGATNSELARRATEADDPVRLAAIYKEFLAWNANPERPTRQVAPNTGGKVNTKLDKTKPTYSLDEFQKFEKEFQKNSGIYTPEQLAEAQKKMDLYIEAGSDGRLI